MLKPKLIENEIDFQCYQMHSKFAEFVNLDPEVPMNRRLLCQTCKQINQTKEQFMGYRELLNLFISRQNQKIQQLEFIVNPHFQLVEQFINIILIFRSKAIQIFENLISISQQYIASLIDQITSYSFFEELERFIKKEESINIPITFISQLQKANDDLKNKVIQKLEQLQSIFEIQQYKDILKNMQDLTFQQLQLQSSFRQRENQEYSFVQFLQNYEDAIQQQWQLGSQEREGVIFDNICEKYWKTKFKINQSQFKELTYTEIDGSILRKDQFQDILKKPKVIVNLEQIKQLQWIGQIGQNQKKIGKWIALWNGEGLVDVYREYSEEGRRQGLSCLIIQNYHKNAQAFQMGEYQNDYRIGIWKYVYEDLEIGGGQYDDVGQKTGKWIELSLKFSNQSQVVYEGDYINGKKVAKWSINYRQNNEQPFQQIGGGFYNEEHFKIGKWIELNEELHDQHQIIYEGEYKNGKKFNRWNICYRQQIKTESIGGGVYDQSNQKQGKWIEFCDNLHHQSQVTYEGEYRNGQRINNWEIYWKFDTQKELIGGGSYNDQQQKIGSWIELADNFFDQSQVIYKGDYQSNKKTNKWVIQYRYNNEKPFEIIGGGQYDLQNEKLGKWIELSLNFWNRNQVILQGNYNKGKKVNKWETIWRWDRRNEQIGGGLYDEFNLKNGYWIELSDNFQDRSQVIYTGNYNKGQKIGQWIISWRSNSEQQFQQIGGGYYNDNCRKTGKWIELSQNFQNEIQIRLNGIYDDGKKENIWGIYFRQSNSLYFSGGGMYNKNGLKDGQWTELSQKFNQRSQVLYKGEYMNGSKVGKWNTCYRLNNDQPFEQIGGGQYDLNIKQGQWVDLSPIFNHRSLITYCGFYEMQRKVGRWDTFLKNNKMNELIGGGQYTENKKNGKWIEISENFHSWNQVIFSGFYQNGIKVGKWEEFKRGEESTKQEVKFMQESMEKLAIKPDYGMKNKQQNLILSRKEKLSLYYLSPSTLKLLVLQILQAVFHLLQALSSHNQYSKHPHNSMSPASKQYQSKGYN